MTLKSIREDYISKFAEAKKEIDKYSGMWRYLAICKFNVEFFNKEFYTEFNRKPHDGTFIQCEFESNRYTENFILQDVLDFCLSTDLCQQIGMSFDEIMQLDFATWNLIKKKYQNMNTLRKATLNSIQANSLNENTKLLDAEMRRKIEHERRSGI